MKCEKILSTLKYLKLHETKCKGVHSLQCPKCRKEFNTSQAKCKHLKTGCCTVTNPYYLTTINNHKNTTTNNNITINNTKQIIHNHISINPFGKENCDYLLDENRRLKHIIENRAAFMQQLIEAIHFDQEHPENHNILMTNLQSKHIMIHNGIKFVKALKEPTLDKLIREKRKLINGNIEELELTTGTEKYIKEKMNKLRTNEEIQKILKDKIELICYNNREICSTNNEYQNANQHNHISVI